ncbi:sugar kinase [bacterium]|nr:sugar kinase [bacterium]RQV99164.1 MAG: sugar kinase [bacterium]
MHIQLPKNRAYAMLVPTSMGLRIIPTDGQPVYCSHTFKMTVTSAESNVASVVSYLGFPVKVLTAFVQGSPLSRMIKDNLASRHMDFEGPEIKSDGPWGVRHQINVADSGYGSRGPQVYNDRAGEVGRHLYVRDFDLDRIFGQEGVQIMHMSGLIGALSAETGHFCLELARSAKKVGTFISFDLNYRASFWKNREKELREIFTEIASLSDILVGNEEDFQLCLGIKGPETGGRDLADKIEGFKEMIGRVKMTFPNASVFATTLRQVVHTNRHLWGAVLSEGDHFHIVEPREIVVIDRIGGGDGFVGGLLYGILKGWKPEKWIQFGWATGALVTTLLTDYAQPDGEEQIWRIWEGNARVKR